MARRTTPKSQSEAPSTTQTTRRRLTDADRQKIHELSQNGKSNGEIALEIPTSLATVSKVLTSGVNGGVTVRRARREQLDTPTETMSETQRRLINLAVAILRDEPILESEKFELRQVIDARIAEARETAVQHALANL